MPNFLNILKPRLRRKKSADTIRIPSIKITSDPAIRRQDIAVLPEVGMYSVLLLNGAQILVKYTKILPYTIYSHGGVYPDSSYTYVKPKPDGFEVQEGRHFTLLVGEMHVVALIIQILSHSLTTTLVANDEHAQNTIPVLQPDYSESSHRIPPVVTWSPDGNPIATATFLKEIPAVPITPTIPTLRPDAVAYPTPESEVPAPVSQGRRKRSSRKVSSSTWSSLKAAETPVPCAIPQGNSSHFGTPHSLCSASRQGKISNTMMAPPGTAEPLLPQHSIPPRNQHIAPVPPVPTLRPNEYSQRGLTAFTPQTPSPLKDSVSYKESPSQRYEVPIPEGILHGAETHRHSASSSGSINSPTSRSRQVQVAVPSTRTPNSKSYVKKDSDQSKRVRSGKERIEPQSAETLLQDDGQCVHPITCSKARKTKTRIASPSGRSDSPRNDFSKKVMNRKQSRPDAVKLYREIKFASPHHQEAHLEWVSHKSNKEAKVDVRSKPGWPDAAVGDSNKAAEDQSSYAVTIKWKGKLGDISSEYQPTIHGPGSDDVYNNHTGDPVEDRHWHVLFHQGPLPSEREHGDILPYSWYPRSAHGELEGLGYSEAFIPAFEPPSRRSSSYLAPLDGIPLPKQRGPDIPYHLIPIGTERHGSVQPKDRTVVAPPIKHKPLPALPTVAS